MVLAATPALQHAKDSVESEILAMCVLIALHTNDMIPAHAAFIGGTALRLCHGSPRMSIDLGFHLPPDAPAWSLDRDGLAQGVENVISAPVDVSWPTASRSRLARISADLPERSRFLKRPVTMLDAGRGVQVDVSPTNVFLRFAGAPPGVSDLHAPFAIMASSAEEILADKHLALVGRAKRIKQRDVFDILWLRQRGVDFNADMLAHKLTANRLDGNQFHQALLARAKAAGDGIADGSYEDEMAKFLPAGSPWASGNRDMGDAIQRLIEEHARDFNHVASKVVANAPRPRGSRVARE